MLTPEEITAADDDYSEVFKCLHESELSKETSIAKAIHQHLKSREINKEK